MGRPQLYTKNGHSMYDMVSLLQKAIRRGDVEIAGYAANELRGRYNAYLWRRLLAISAEDCYGIMTKEIEAMDGNVRAAEFMRDTAGQKQENIQAQKEFEYKKERDAGISQEIEDLDDIEEEIYGKANESQESKEEGSEAEEDDNV